MLAGRVPAVSIDLDREGAVVRMSRPEPGVWVHVVFTVGTLVVLAIMFFIAKAIMGSA